MPALIGLGLAMGMRILLLLTISWIVGLTAPVFTIAGHPFSWRDLILIGGGLFLLWKATTEIGESLEGEPAHHVAPDAPTASFGGVLVQILLLDIVFSLDSVLTAVGMVDEVAIMIVGGRHRGRGDARRVRTAVASSSTTTRRSRCWRWRSCS